MGGVLLRNVALVREGDQNLIVALRLCGGLHAIARAGFEPATFGYETKVARWVWLCRAKFTSVRVTYFRYFSA